MISANNNVVTYNIPDIIASSTPPQNPYVGMIWIDTSTTPAQLKYWDGSQWNPFTINLDTTTSISTAEALSLASTLSNSTSLLASLIWS